MMTVNPILAFQSLGYTQREATFLYLVGMHSGYFLRRQFNYSIQRQKGYLAHHFIEKARIGGHIEVLDYGQGRSVYHLFAKPIYRLLGNPESQSRRWKGDGQIRSRLMALDYVLENRNDHYLETDDAKFDFFARVRRIDPQILSTSSRRVHPFLASFPISITDPARPLTSSVRFPFIDADLFSMKKFSRFLTELLPLFAAIGTFEVVYTATADLSFANARTLFYRALAQTFVERQQVLGDFRPTTTPIERAAPPRVRGTFTSLLLRNPYPNLLRNEPRGSGHESDRRSHSEGATA
jgi:hypothetical protein